MAIICSHLSHGYIGGAIDSIDGFLPTIVGYFLVSSSINSRSRYNGFVLLLIALSTFLAYEGWLQYTTGFAHGGAVPLIIKSRTLDGEIVETIRIRWHGIFGDPNDLGLAFVTVIPFLLNMVLQKRFLLPVCCLPLVLTAIYLSNSRGSIIALIATLVAFFIIRYRSKKGALIGLLLSAILFTLGPSRMTELSSSEESAYNRLDSWYAGLQMFISHPLFGVGQGMYGEYNRLTSHNSFVHVMAELGLFGSFFFFGLIYFPLNWIWRNIIQNQQYTISESDHGMASSIFSSLIGMLVVMFFLSRAYNLVPAILLAMASAYIRVSVADGFKEVKQPSMNEHLKNIAVATVLAIVFMYFMIKVLL